MSLRFADCFKLFVPVSITKATNEVLLENVFKK